MRQYLLVIALGMMAAAWPALGADRTTLAKPIYTEVFTRVVGGGRSEKITGNLISFDDQSVSIRTSAGDRQFDWISLSATSAFTLRSRLIDKTVAANWLELGRFGWSIGATEQGRLALARASRMDASLKSDAQAILASSPGSALTDSDASAASSGTSSGTNSGGRELLVPASTSQPSSTAGGVAGGNVTHAFGMMPRPRDDSPRTPTMTYQKSTPGQNEMAISKAKLKATKIANEFHVTFDTLETDHFLIFTDWDPREYAFLETNLEEAYDTVSRQFEIPSTENVFVGKLPVYMFAHFGTFAKLTDSIGFLGQPTPRTLRGYYEGSANGSGRMIMYKPGADDVAEAEKEWAHCLVHEFTHAFVARYRTNARVPRWLNEGIAEVIAAKNFPFPGTYPYATRMAHEHTSAGTLFDDDKMPSGEWYPVMQTMVELLIAQDHAGFKKMFDDIKAGTDGEAALKKYYHIDYDQLTADWREAILHR